MGGSSEILMFYGLRIILYIYGRPLTTTLAKKIVTAEIFMRLIRSAIMRNHATSTSICKCNATRDAQMPRAGRVDVEPSLDIARYHMIELQINLMNFSAVTIFLARVVSPWAKIKKSEASFFFSSHDQFV